MRCTPFDALLFLFKLFDATLNPVFVSILSNAVYTKHVEGLRPEALAYLYYDQAEISCWFRTERADTKLSLSGTAVPLPVQIPRIYSAVRADTNSASSSGPSRCRGPCTILGVTKQAKTMPWGLNGNAPLPGTTAQPMSPSGLGFSGRSSSTSGHLRQGLADTWLTHSDPILTQQRPHATFFESDLGVYATDLDGRFSSGE